MLRLIQSLRHKRTPPLTATQRQRKAESIRPAQAMRSLRQGAQSQLHLTQAQELSRMRHLPLRLPTQLPRQQTRWRYRTRRMRRTRMTRTAWWRCRTPAFPQRIFPFMKCGHGQVRIMNVCDWKSRPNSLKMTGNIRSISPMAVQALINGMCAWKLR